MVELIEGVSVSYPKNMNIDRKELISYLKYVAENTDGTLESVKITPAEDGQVQLDWEVRQRKFERIRRITGKPTR